MRRYAPLHPSIQPEYCDIVEAGGYLGVIKALPDDTNPVRTYRNQLQKMYRLVRQNQIPHSRLGSRLFFNIAALRNLVRTGAHHTWDTSQSSHPSQALPEHVLRPLTPKPDPH